MRKFLLSSLSLLVIGFAGNVSALTLSSVDGIWGTVGGTDVKYPENVLNTSYGNIFEESLVDIFNRHKNELLYNLEIEGPCGRCKNSDVCFGCRSNAQTYFGNTAASDPKCWLNPETPERIFS